VGPSPGQAAVELGPQILQGAYSGLDLGELFRQRLPHVGAGPGPFVHHREDPLDFAEPETERLGLPYEGHPPGGLGSVETVTGWGAGVGPQEPDALVVAQRVPGDPGGFR